LRAVNGSTNVDAVLSYVKCQAVVGCLAMYVHLDKQILIIAVWLTFVDCSTSYASFQHHVCKNKKWNV